MNSDRSRLGEMIRQKRKELGLSGKEFASVIGVSPSHLCLIEKGERTPSLGKLRQISKALGISYIELLVVVGTIQETDLEELRRTNDQEP